jgi:hypothetical protein
MRGAWVLSGACVLEVFCCTVVGLGSNRVRNAMNIPAAAEVDCESGKGATMESTTTITHKNLNRR